MAEEHDLNPTDASNTARFPENQAPSTVNNGARALEGLLARYFVDQSSSVVATLSGSVIQITASRNSLTLTGTTSNYRADLMQAFTMGDNPITGPASLNIDGIGAISLRDNEGSSLSSSTILAGQRCLAVKDGTNNYFRLLYPARRTGADSVLTTQGDVLYRDGSGLQRLAIGTAGQTLKVNGGATAPEWGSGVTTFTSANQTITADSQLDVAHGLGAVPFWVEVSLKCTTADQGYSIGDEIRIGGALNTQGTDDGFHTVVDATNVSIITGVSLIVLGKASFDDAGLTLTSWRYVVRAAVA